MMYLRTQDISVRHKNSAPLSFPDLNIKAGDEVLLLGPSGSGKTTLLSVLAGFLKPADGKVFIQEKDFYLLSPAKRDHMRGRDFGFVFQTLHLLPSLTLDQNIKLAGDMADVKVEENRLKELLMTLGLSDKAHRKPDALSQGEQQRAAIARAVYLKPKIIMADEPTSALDDINADAVIKLLKDQAKATGAALLIATHDSRIKTSFSKIINLDSQKKDAA